MNDIAKQLIADEIQLVLTAARFAGNKVNWANKKDDPGRIRAAGIAQKIYRNYYPDEHAGKQAHFAYLTKCPCLGAQIWTQVISSWNIIASDLESKKNVLIGDQVPKVRIS